MPYEIRNFRIVQSQTSEGNSLIIKKFDSWNSFTDIYVFKEDAISVGVKFRDIQIKNYGFKINSVELKFDAEALEKEKYGKQKKQIDPHCYFYQNWNKHQIKFKYRLIQPSFFANQIKINQVKSKDLNEVQKNFQQQMQYKYVSFQSQLGHLNKKITQTIQNYLLSKSSLKGILKEDNILTRWINQSNSIKQLFVICKNKVKTSTYETGKLILHTLSGSPFSFKAYGLDAKPLKVIKLKTISEESNSRDLIQHRIDLKSQQSKLNFQNFYHLDNQQQIKCNLYEKSKKYSFNISYPQLLNDFYQYILLEK